MSRVIFSGIQPSGDLHIGNYIGAINQWVSLQSHTESIFCIVDLHAITIPQDPDKLKKKVLETAALYLACGIDPEKSHIFVQSENPNHPYLAWILNTITPFGQLERMTQFKDKSNKIISVATSPSSQSQKTYVGVGHHISVGVFDYPVLMAADILLYKTDEVPVGEDQKQHIELTRDLAEKFNKHFGEVFKLPAASIQKETSRIMSLQNPENKMSKSEIDPLGTINLLDPEDVIREKVKKAVTDSGSNISRDGGSAAISNLLSIYSAFKNQTLEQSLNELEGKSYAEFKNVLADLLVDKLSPIQKRYNEIMGDEKLLREILDKGRDYAIEKSTETLNEVREKVGLI